jgi:hypothetical protein
MSPRNLLHHSIVNEMHEADLFLVVATFKHDLLALECTIEFMIKQWNSGRVKRDLRKQQLVVRLSL